MSAFRLKSEDGCISCKLKVVDGDYEECSIGAESCTDVDGISSVGVSKYYSHILVKVSGNSIHSVIDSVQCFKQTVDSGSICPS
jgi:hypothetical protein